MTTCRRRRPAARLASVIAFCFALGAVLGGCQRYLEDSSARTVGEVTDDATIQLIVKKRLVGARDIRGMRINVEVHQGVVTLIGKVRSESERKRAVEVAAGVPNVTKVVDRLELR